MLWIKPIFDQLKPESVSLVDQGISTRLRATASSFRLGYVPQGGGHSVGHRSVVVDLVRECPLRHEGALYQSQRVGPVTFSAGYTPSSPMARRCRVRSRRYSNPALPPIVSVGGRTGKPRGWWRICWVRRTRASCRRSSKRCNHCGKPAITPLR